MSSITRSLSAITLKLGIDTSKARSIPRTDFGSVLTRRAQSPTPRYSAGDIGVFVLANELLESGLSEQEVIQRLSKLPQGDSIDVSPEQWEIDRLLAIIADLQNLLEEQRMRLKECQEGLVSRLEAIGDHVNTIGDDAQLANLDLQNALQKQQQILQLLSNLSKMLHDTMMAIIRNIKA